MDDFYKICGIGMAIIDLNGIVLVSDGSQDICTQFHRINPITLKNCIESDCYLTKKVKEGEFLTYKCKNNMWDIVTPIYVAGRHVGNSSSGSSSTRTRFWTPICSLIRRRFMV